MNQRNSLCWWQENVFRLKRICSGEKVEIQADQETLVLLEKCHTSALSLKVV
jgi:hypothetical protein